MSLKKFDEEMCKSASNAEEMKNSTKNPLCLVNNTSLRKGFNHPMMAVAAIT